LNGHKSKTVATWTALLFGTLGLHRFYLHGWRDWKGWLHPLPTAIGLIGAQRMNELGQDDRLAWLLIPLLGLSIAQAMLTAIVYGLTPDARWAERQRQPLQVTGWGPVFGVIVALLLGATALMATVAYGGQRFFEYQLEADNAPTAR